MTTTNVLAQIFVSDFDGAPAWYEGLLGRPADRLPMDGTAEWQLAGGGGLQVDRSEKGVGTSNVIIEVDDFDATLADLAGRGIDATAPDAPSSRLRLATVEDPEGNTITISQRLG